MEGPGKQQETEHDVEQDLPEFNLRYRLPNQRKGGRQQRVETNKQE